MKHHEHTIQAADGTSIHVERWEPRGDVRFVVVLVHGGAEHVGRYERLANRFGEHGGLCFGPDHRGQGKSGGRRGHVPSFSQYAADLGQVMQAVAEQLPENQRPDAIPWFLFGHSMGGLISLTYLLDQRRGPAAQEQAALPGSVQAVPLRGAIISSPLLEVAVKVNPLKRWVGLIAAKIWPTLALPTGIPPSAICRDPDEVERYERDPRRVGVVTAGWFGAMNQATARVRAEVAKIELPCLWYVGTGDTICSHQATMSTFKSIPEPDAHGQSLHCFGGYYHELHNEPPELRKPVLELVEGWVLERLEAASA
ncbi:alpha/beta hydrolase [Paraliomyxa miuraensis]|uniref:alpha/beta hydrolase n=1 Tax=Paraliomyxa miuraensis TaxID=376150 RepID=UPI0022569929|nr:alpha/beta hydrolase [Paraliomyxa miuraensis]MCX4242134.1 lysophospholipase [Paraliomyxa miuraensis]